jgi:hypothetical protein
MTSGLQERYERQKATLMPEWWVTPECAINSRDQYTLQRSSGYVTFGAGHRKELMARVSIVEGAKSPAELESLKTYLRRGHDRLLASG